jgi:plasmid stabilization system protein ParE
VRIVWTEPAETDLDDLFEYIARDSAIYAELFIDRILDAVSKLAELPPLAGTFPKPVPIKSVNSSCRASA